MEAVFPCTKTLLFDALSTLLKSEVKLTVPDKTLLRQKWNEFEAEKTQGRAAALCQCLALLLNKYGFARESGILRRVYHDYSRTGLNDAFERVGAIARHHRSATPHMSNDAILANLWELSQNQIWARDFPGFCCEWMRIAHAAYPGKEVAANMFFYFAMSTANTEAEYIQWFTSAGPNTYQDDIAKITALKHHFASAPHMSLSDDQMNLVQRLYEKAAYLKFYYAEPGNLYAFVKDMMRKGTDSLSHSI